MSIFDIEYDIGSSYPSADEDSGQSERSNAYIYKQYGGFNQFMLSYGLKIWNDDDVQEAKAMATEMRRGDEQDAKEAREAKRQRAKSSMPAKPSSSNSSATEPNTKLSAKSTTSKLSNKSSAIPSETKSSATEPSTKLSAKSTISKRSNKSSATPSETKSSAVRDELVPLNTAVDLPTVFIPSVWIE